MATSYNLEPTPSAKVLLKTTSGDILLELFAKETPLASRNFLQLCLDGYYDNTIFHRLVPNFIIQGGDPTGTGHGGEAIYDGGLFADEFNSRLRFNRRGVLGMANGGRKDDNGSQFFITLGEARELDKKNTMFGRVAGDTIYNVMKMGKAELDGVEGSERPLYPTKILGAEIIVNPFEDMEKREVKVSTAGKDADDKAVKNKKKKKKGKQMLSFADEEGGEDGEDVGGGRFRSAGMQKKPKYDTRLLADAPKEEKEKRGRSTTPPPRKMSGQVPAVEAPPGPAPVAAQAPRSTKTKKQPARSSRSPSTPSSPRSPTPEETRLSRTEAKIAEVKAAMKRSANDEPSSSSTKDSKQKSKSLLDIQRSLLPSTSIPARKRKRNNGAEDAAYEQGILSAMSAFKSKLQSAQKSSSSTSHDENGKDTDADMPDAPAPQADIDPDADEQNVCDLHFIPNCKSCKWHEEHDQNHNKDDNDEDDDGWLTHKLTFEKDRLGKDLNWKKKNEEELVVIDPREKTKEVLKEERRRKDERKGGSRAFRSDGHGDRDRGKDRDRDRDRDRRR